MRRNLLAAALFLIVSSTGMAANQVFKDNFEAQSAGQQLDHLTNWKFYEGWIKPEDGKIVVEEGNKFLRMQGDIFLPNQFNLVDKLTLRFKIRSTGTNEEVGGLVIRSTDDKTRYDALCAYQSGSISLVASTEGQSDTVAKAESLKNNVFQNVVVEVERVPEGVKFTISVDGNKAVERVETNPLSMLNENFIVGFFTYNQKLIDLDDVEFTQGK